MSVTNTWIVEVTADADFEDLDPNDCDHQGNCIVDGAYRIALTGALASAEDPKKAALDVFHAIVPISNIDDYDILIRPEVPLDAGEGWLRLDIGVFSEMPKPELPAALRDLPPSFEG